MRKLLKKHGFAPDVLVTDQLRSYAAAKSELRLTARGLSGPPFASQSPFETERLRTSATTPTETTVLQQSRPRCEQHAVSPFLNELADVKAGDCGISRH
jgi:transposase-like protein